MSVTQDYSDVDEPYGVRLRRIRKEKGVGQRTLALGCRLDPGFISKIENGLRGTSHEINELLADFLEVDADYLRHGVGYWTGVAADEYAARGVRLMMTSAATAEEASHKLQALGFPVAYVLKGVPDAFVPVPS